MQEQWRSRAACRGLGPEVFYVERVEGEDNHAETAKAVCVSCEVQFDCLSYAIRTNEPDGVWGGVGFDRRSRIRALFNRGDILAFERAVIDEVENLARHAGIIEDERPVATERPCERCDGVVAAGRHPVDRNGRDATCGLASTYNKGCRCSVCVQGKADYGRARRVERQRPPRGGDARGYGGPEAQRARTGS